MREQAIDPPEYENFEEKYEKEIKEFVDDFKSEIERILKRINSEDFDKIISNVEDLSNDALAFVEELERFKENKSGE